MPPYAQAAPAAGQAPPAYAPSAQAAPAAYAPPATPYGTAPAYAGYPAAYGAKTNALAVVSLVAGIANFVLLFGVGAIVAVITGHIALRQLRTNGENGRGLALTGVILGWVGVGLTLLGVIFFVIWFVVLFGTIGAASYSYS
jgi:hypothetical protein